MKKFCLLFVLIVACSVLLCSCGNEEPYDYDLSEYVTLGTFPAVEYDEADLNEKLDEKVKEITSEYEEEKEITDRAVEDGDIVNIDYVGTMDGKEFEGGKDEGHDLTIGSNSFIDGFEDGLVGKKIGEEVKLDLVFPEDYDQTDLAGKSVVFSVKINSIKAMVIPELTDQMVKDEGVYETAEEFLTETKKQLLEEMIWENYVDSCTASKYPEKEVKTYYDNLVSMYRQMAYSNGISLANYVAMVGYGTEEDFYAEILSGARNTVKEEMVLYLTIRNNNITFTEDQYNKIGLEIATEQGYESLDDFEDYVGKIEIEKQVYMDLMVEKAIENAIVISEEKADDEDNKKEIKDESSTETSTTETTAA